MAESKRAVEYVLLECDCMCSEFIISKSIDSDDGEVTYNISVQDSRYDHNGCTILGRIKNAFKVLFGKPVYYNDLYIDDPEKFKTFVNKLNHLVT